MDKLMSLLPERTRGAIFRMMGKLEIIRPRNGRRMSVRYWCSITPRSGEQSAGQRNASATTEVEPGRTTVGGGEHAFATGGTVSGPNSGIGTKGARQAEKGATHCREKYSVAGARVFFFYIPAERAGKNACQHPSAEQSPAGYK